MSDPVQLLIDAGAIPTSPFGPSSRYAAVAIGRYQLTPSEPAVAYVLRRFIPQFRDIPISTMHIVRDGDRADLLAAHYLGDPELLWRIVDANAVADVLLLATKAGDRIAIPLPPGSVGA